jgi:hypothetical protein
MKISFIFVPVTLQIMPDDTHITNGSYDDFMFELSRKGTDR